MRVIKRFATRGEGRDMRMPAIDEAPLAVATWLN